MDNKNPEGEGQMNQNARPCATPAGALRKSLQQMAQIRKGELPKQSVFDLLDELDSEDEEQSWLKEKSICFPFIPSWTKRT